MNANKPATEEKNKKNTNAESVASAEFVETENERSSVVFAADDILSGENIRGENASGGSTEAAADEEVAEKKDDSDEILLENYAKNESEVTASFIEPPEEKTYSKPRKITIQTLFLSALTLKKQNEEDPIIKKMRPVNTVWLLVLIAISAGVFLLVADFVDEKIYIPVLVSFCAVALPAALMTLNYELCAEKNVSIMQIFVAFCIGVLAYAFINAFSGGVLVKFVYQAVADAVFVPVIWCLIELLALLFVIRIYNITDLQSCVLLAVCIGMGICFTKSIFDLFSSLFLQAEITVPGGTKDIGYGILDDAESFKKSISALAVKIPLDCIYYPIMFASWSIVIGNAASMFGTLKQKNRKAPLSVYLLLILVIALYMLCEFKASLGGFDIALKIFCAVVSLFVALKQINVCIEKAVEEIKESPND